MNLLELVYVFAGLWIVYFAFLVSVESLAKNLPRGKARSLLTTGPIMLEHKGFSVFSALYSGLIAAYTLFLVWSTHPTMTL
jgi:hypothetical protein